MTLVQRMIGAAGLKPAVYEEVEADKTATSQATLVVVLSAIATGIGNLNGGLAGLIIGTIGALLGWYVWAFVTYVIGTKLLPEAQTQADHGELLRTLGFAASPGLLRVAGVIPGAWALVFTITSLWTLVTTVIAVRQALDYKSTGRAVAVCLLGWFLQLGLLALLYLLMPNVAVGS